jgi:dTMP kinase
MGAKPEAYYTRVAERFAEMADQDSARFRLIDATGGIAQVTDRLFAALGDLL